MVARLARLAWPAMARCQPTKFNTMRVILGELGDIIRGAQINDVVQRDTFRDTFLVEIGNVMALLAGHRRCALHGRQYSRQSFCKASRCLFICTDDTQAGWKVLRVLATGQSAKLPGNPLANPVILR